MNYYQSLRYLLGENILKIPPLIILFLIVSLGDLIGISAIGAYLSLLFDPSVIERFDAYEFSKYLKDYNYNEIIVFFGLIMVGIFLIKFIIILISQYVILAFAANEKAKIQKQLIDGILNQKYENFLYNNAGDNLSSIASLSGYYAECLSAIFQSASGIIVILALFIFFGVTNLSSLLMLIGLVGFIFILFNLVFAKRLSYQGASFVRGASSMLQGTTDISKGLKEIKTFGKEKFFMRKIVDAANALAKASIRLSFASTIPKNLIEVVLMFLIVAIVGINIKNGVDISSMFVTLGMFVAGVVRIAPLLSSLQTSWNTLIFSKEPIMRLSLLLQKQDMGVDREREIDAEMNEPYNNSNKEAFKYLELNKIYYKYPDSETYALEDISFKIQKGDFIGLIGASGSGKTSLINLILGFLNPSSGEIIYNDNNLQDNIEDWRSKCAYLPQDIFLIEGTLKENITLEQKIQSPETLDQAVKLSKLSNLIETLPNGLETGMGDGGIRLSGGQKQRVAIARSIYHERDIFMLDESTSALDPATEKAVMEELVAMRNHKTIIAIAHRLSTLKECNKIYRLNEGRIEGPFTYKEIEAGNGG